MLLYSDFSYAINGAAFYVYNQFGHGFLEAVYQEALEIEFQRRNIPYEREKELKITSDVLMSWKRNVLLFNPSNPSNPWSIKRNEQSVVQ